MTLIKNQRREFNILFFSFTLLSLFIYSHQGNTKDKTHQNIVAYTNVNILDPGVELPITNSTILVSDGKILKIQSNSAAVPENASEVNLDGNWVIPGLIDGHVHLAQSGGAFARPDILDATKIRSYHDEQSWLLEHQKEILSRYTRLGITTIFDLGGPLAYLAQYQKFSQHAQLPEIYFSGPLLAPMKVEKLDVNGSTFSKVSSSDEAISLLKQQITQGIHILKILWTQETGLSSQQLFERYQPAIALAKDSGIVVAIHVEELESAKWAVKSGADILVHGVMREVIDNELISMMLSKDVTYMPTLTAFQHYFDFFKGTLSFSQFELETAHKETIDSFSMLANNLSKADQRLPIFRQYMPMVDDREEKISTLSQQEQSIISQLRMVFSNNYLALQKQNLKKVIDAGVNVSLGTDAGNLGTIHGSSLLGEIEAWQLAGISNKEILKAITIGNALAFNLEQTIGSLSAGKNANFVVLDSNPYVDISTLSRPQFVFKKGISVYKKQRK